MNPEINPVAAMRDACNKVIVKPISNGESWMIADALGRTRQGNLSADEVAACQWILQHRAANLRNLPLPEALRAAYDIDAAAESAALDALRAAVATINANMAARARAIKAPARARADAEAAAAPVSVYLDQYRVTVGKWDVPSLRAWPRYAVMKDGVEVFACAMASQVANHMLRVLDWHLTDAQMGAVLSLSEVSARADGAAIKAANGEDPS